jgi:tRNA pseudouridine38-40 synthase
MAAAELIGEHDFKRFCSNKKMKKSTVRRLDSIEILEEGSKVIFVYTGNGFLYNMVRILTGTLLEVGLGKRKPEEMGEILKAMDREAAGMTAPPEGLFLERVDYR